MFFNIFLFDIYETNEELSAQIVGEKKFKNTRQAERSESVSTTKENNIRTKTLCLEIYPKKSV